MFGQLNITPALPEIMMLGMACLIVLVDVFLKQDKKRIITYALVQVTLIAAIAMTVGQFGATKALAFHNLFVQDHLAVLLKVFIYASVFIAFYYSRYFVPEFDMPVGEYYLLGLFSVLGMAVLVSGNNLLTLFLGLELFSLPVYAMVALRRDDTTATEAAMKYFIIGAMASAMLLYGLSMIYGATGALDLAAIAKSISLTGSEFNLILVFGVVFVVAGLAFKVGLVPFHMWVPDVYEGAPSSVTLFISTAPKIAGLALMLRLLTEATPGLHIPWQHMLIVLAILSMALGNLTAIVQSNILRMLAYSSIAHMGYMALGLLSGTPAGYAAATFYMITYVIIALGSFGMIVMLSHKGFVLKHIDDFKGLNSRNPWLAFMMLIMMFAMAGVPPLVGFMAKLSVLEALIRVHLVWLAALALIFAVIGAYYYIRVVKVMYFEDPEITTPIECAMDMRLVMSANGLFVMALGIFPSLLFHYCHLAFGVGV